MLSPYANHILPLLHREPHRYCRPRLRRLPLCCALETCGELDYSGTTATRGHLWRGKPYTIVGNVQLELAPKKTIVDGDRPETLVGEGVFEAVSD